MTDALSPQHWKNHFALSNEPGPHDIDISVAETQLGSRLPHILNFIPLGSKVLEAGCGSGEYVFTLNNRGYEAYGLDFVQELVDRAKKFSIETGLCSPDRFLQGDILRLPYEDASFDAYVSMGVVEHFSDADQFTILSEARRILRPGGRIFITVPNNLFPWYVTTKLRTWFGHRRLAPMRYLSMGHLKRLARSCAFQVVDIFRFSAETALVGGLLLGEGRVRGIKNPLNLFRGPLLRFARRLDQKGRVPYLGVHTVMIAEKI